MASAPDRSALEERLAAQRSEAGALMRQLADRWEAMADTLEALEALEAVESPLASKVAWRGQRAMVFGRMTALRAEYVELAATG